MMPGRYGLRMTGRQHAQLFGHLFPGDGCEAVALALCGRYSSRDRQILMVHRVEPVPYAECKVRRPDRVTWSTERLVPLLNEATRRGMGILKIHSHPGGYPRFSEQDDESDRDLFESIYSWIDTEQPHASAIMFLSGEVLGRSVTPNGEFESVDSVSVAGDDILQLSSCIAGLQGEVSKRHRQLFGSGTTNRLRRMSVAVVGCSGTGSPLVEQLARLGVGRLVLVDPDKVESHNLNRIVNASREDAYLGRYKVEVLATAIARMGLDTEATLIRSNLATAAAVRAIAGCDVAFGCMDGVEGRHLLNRLCCFYLIPYFDIGVKLVADGLGGIDEACGAIHYVQPDGSSLLSRRVYTMARVAAEGLRRTDPGAYQDQVDAGYIEGVVENRPAVISVNMQLAAMAVNEFLARLHPYRLDPNGESAVVRVGFMQNECRREGDGAPCQVLSRHAGRGDVTPSLDMPALSDERPKSELD